VVGPSTRRNVELVLCDVLEVFTIQFQAAGFFRLFRTPMRDLADRAYEARSIIGPIASQMEQRLGEAVSFEERTRIANEFLLRRLEEEGAADRVFGIANRFLAEDGALSVRKAAATAGLSVRQFERRFAEQVGLPPKPYARIVRFNAALQAKASVPQRRWTNIAHEFGYFDQMHMIRDFERLAGETPTAFQQRRDALTWA
jgi:AraC-like DNA-binding protein